MTTINSLISKFIIIEENNKFIEDWTNLFKPWFKLLNFYRYFYPFIFLISYAFISINFFWWWVCNWGNSAYELLVLQLWHATLANYLHWKTFLMMIQWWHGHVYEKPRWFLDMVGLGGSILLCSIFCHYVVNVMSFSSYLFVLLFLILEWVVANIDQGVCVCVLLCHMHVQVWVFESFKCFLCHSP
jgi:hypothetical protein